jgi:tetratricopeptide (TPR) repeat protein
MKQRRQSVNRIAGILALVLSFSLQESTCIAQPDSLLQLKGGQHMDQLWHWYHHNLPQDSSLILSQLDKLESTFLKNKQRELAQQAWFFKFYYRGVDLYAGKSKSIDFLHQGIMEAKEKDWQFILGLLYTTLGLTHTENQQWGPAFENLLKGDALLETYGYKQYPDAQRFLYLIGLAYYKVGEHRKAATALRKYFMYSPEKLKRNHEYYALNTLALCYQREQMPDSASYFYQQAYQNAIVSGNSYWAVLIHGNLGQLYFEQQKYDEALPLILEDYTESYRNGIKGSAMNAAVTLAAIYLAQNDLTRARTYLDSARRFAAFATHPLPVFYYDTRFDLHKRTGDYQLAVMYADSARIKKDSVHRSQDLEVLDQALMKVEVERHSSEMRQLENARKSQVMLRNTLLIILTLSAFIMVQFYHRRIYQRDKELQVASLNEKLAVTALDNAKKDLDLYTRNLKEKNELIEAIRLEMEELRITGIQQMDERTERLNQLLQSTILTDHDWVDFRNMFEKVYPGFFARLREKMPDLTPADTRLLALTKLNLSSKEMASILGISADSIKKSRQRLRRRLNLPEEGSLDELLEGL